MFRSCLELTDQTSAFFPNNGCFIFYRAERQAKKDIAERNCKDQGIGIGIENRHGKGPGAWT